MWKMAAGDLEESLKALGKKSFAGIPEATFVVGFTYIFISSECCTIICNFYFLGRC